MHTQTFASRGGLTLGASFFLAALLLVTGCQSSGIAARRKANADAYAALSAEEKALVDRGDLSKGISTNAVLIAWGKPGDLGVINTPNGAFVIWDYYLPIPPGLITSKVAPQRSGTTARPVVYQTINGRRTPVNLKYLSRTVVFREGRLESWQINPPPH